MHAFRNFEINTAEKVLISRWTRWSFAVYGMLAVGLIVLAVASSPKANSATGSFLEAGHPNTSTAVVDARTTLPEPPRARG